MKAFEWTVEEQAAWDLIRSRLAELDPEAYVYIQMGGGWKVTLADGTPLPANFGCTADEMAGFEKIKPYLARTNQEIVIRPMAHRVAP
jgi:hypothetical protein